MDPLWRPVKTADHSPAAKGAVDDDDEENEEADRDAEKRRRRKKRHCDKSSPDDRH